MGILSGIIGHASEAKLEDAQKTVGELLVPGEEIDAAFKLVRDMIIFTNRRLILVDKQGLTGKKTEYYSIPYRAITHFLIETAGTFDRDSELKIWVSSQKEPIIKEFKKDRSTILLVQKALAAYVCNK